MLSNRYNWPYIETLYFHPLLVENLWWELPNRKVLHLFFNFKCVVFKMHSFNTTLNIHCSMNNGVEDLLLGSFYTKFYLIWPLALEVQTTICSIIIWTYAYEYKFYFYKYVVIFFSLYTLFKNQNLLN